MLLALWWLLERTRFGMLTRAATENRALASALGVDERALFTAVFALGAFLAGLAGALQLPREPANLGMDLAIIAEAFVVTVVGGLGSIPGAFVAALLIGLTKALCIALGTVDVGGIAIAFPKLTLVAEFVVMAIVLVAQPYGLMGTPPAAPPTTPSPSSARWSSRPDAAQRSARSPRSASRRCCPGPATNTGSCSRPTSSSSRCSPRACSSLMGTGGMASFGHAAYFGLGAYAAALAVKRGVPMEAALALSPLVGRCRRARHRLVLRTAFRRLPGHADARVRANRLVDRFSMGRGHRRLERHRRRLACGVARRQAAPITGSRWRSSPPALAAIVWIAHAPLGYSLRACRDSPLRAEAIGIDVRRIQRIAFALAGAFAGLAGGLYAFSKGSISPETLAIPAPSMRWSWCCWAASTRWPDHCWARRHSPGSPTRSPGSPNTGTRCWAPDPADRHRLSDGHRRRDTDVGAEAALRCAPGWEDAMCKLALLLAGLYT